MRTISSGWGFVESDIFKNQRLINDWTDEKEKKSVSLENNLNMFLPFRSWSRIYCPSNGWIVVWTHLSNIGLAGVCVHCWNSLYDIHTQLTPCLASCAEGREETGIIPVSLAFILNNQVPNDGLCSYLTLDCILGHPFKSGQYRCERTDGLKAHWQWIETDIRR